MGLRGPQRNPNSRRGRAEAEKAKTLASASKPQAPARAKPAPIPATDSLTGPEWLSPDQAKLFASVVRDLEAAQVPIKPIDGHAILMTVQCLSGVQETTELLNGATLDPEQSIAALKIKVQLGKELKSWLQLICATPGARARIGLKAEAPKKLGPLAQILAMKQGRKA